MMKVFTLLKTHANAFALLLALILLITTATGCFNRSAPIEELLPTIKADYLGIWDEQTEQIGIESVVYYGRYGDVEVVSVVLNRDAVLPAYSDVIIAGSTFELSVGYDIMTWKEGAFALLQDAYDQGLLTRAQIAEIAEIHENKSYTVFR